MQENEFGILDYITIWIQVSVHQPYFRVHEHGIKIGVVVK